MNKSLWKAVHYFFGKMVEKLIHQKQTHGYSGWDSPGDVTSGRILRKLYENVERGDWVDVANLAMMLDYRKQKEGV
jgi:hypothetical protein